MNVGKTNANDLIFNLFDMEQHKRHGDLPIISTKKIEGKEMEHRGSFVLALGEKTGHRHVITVDDPKTMRIYQISPSLWCLKLESEARLSHEEHETIILAPGVYRVGREQEYDWFGLMKREVVD